MTIRFITNKNRLHTMPDGASELWIGRRYCYEGRSFGRIFLGAPKVWPPMENVIETHEQLVSATKAGL